jgi:DNA-binding transcriptional LysR family regulator
VSGDPFAVMLERQLVKNGLETSEHIVIDSLTAQKRFIEADFGIGLVPASSVEEELRLGTLQVLPLPSLETRVPVMAIYRKRGYMTHAGQLLLSMLTKDSAPAAADAVSG